jgi:hypothetical protein
VQVQLAALAGRESLELLDAGFVLDAVRDLLEDVKPVGGRLGKLTVGDALIWQRRLERSGWAFALEAGAVIPRLADGDGGEPAQAGPTSVAAKRCGCAGEYGGYVGPGRFPGRRWSSMFGRSSEPDPGDLRRPLPSQVAPGGIVGQRIQRLGAAAIAATSSMSPAATAITSSYASSSGGSSSTPFFAQNT